MDLGLSGLLLVVVMRPVSTRLSEVDLEVLSQLEDELDADRSDVLRKLIRAGLRKWQRETALNGLREHELTLREAAAVADVSYVELCTLAADEGIDIGYSVEELQWDLDRI